MKHEFIPEELELELLKLGYDYILIKTYETNIHILWQQAFRWFREKYNFRYSIGHTNIAVVHIPINNYHTTHLLQDNKTYEEAELKTIKKFIEVAKNGK